MARKGQIRRAMRFLRQWAKEEPRRNIWFVGCTGRNWKPEHIIEALEARVMEGTFDQHNDIPAKVLKVAIRSKDADMLRARLARGNEL